MPHHRLQRSLPAREPVECLSNRRPRPSVSRIFAHHVDAGDRRRAAVCSVTMRLRSIAVSLEHQFACARRSIARGEWLELATIDEKKHDVNDFYNVVVEPLLLTLSKGVRIRFGNESVVIVGTCCTMLRFDKLAAIKFFGLKGKSPALLTSAVQESADFRTSPYQGWRHCGALTGELMARKYDEALSARWREPGNIGRGTRPAERCRHEVLGAQQADRSPILDVADARVCFAARRACGHAVFIRARSVS
jgi:hypothetical protein